VTKDKAKKCRAASILLRIWFRHAEATDGAVSLERADALVKGSGDLFLAGAWAAGPHGPAQADRRERSTPAAQPAMMVEKLPTEFTA
jgi:hypothetical protein